MRIVWILLSIIGIIWAVLLLLFLLALFVPIRYRIYGRKKEDVLAKGSASWFWRLLYASVAYEDGELGFQVRVLGIPIGRKKPRGQPEGESEEREETPEVIALERHAPETEGKAEPQNDAETWAEAEPPKEEKLLEEESLREGEPRNEGKAQKKKKKAKKTKEEKAREEEPKPKGKLELIKQFWQENQGAIRLVFAKALRMLKALRPKKLRASIWFGTGDPCSTGELTGALAVLYGFYGGDIHVYPDFSQAIFKGEVIVEGKIRLVTFFWIGVTLLIDKNVWRLIKNIKNLKEDL